MLSLDELQAAIAEITRKHVAPQRPTLTEAQFDNLVSTIAAKVHDFDPGPKMLAHQYQRFRRFEFAQFVPFLQQLFSGARAPFPPISFDEIYFSALGSPKR